MQEKILTALKRSAEYISGEELSATLKITRQGLWKHIQELKDSGYDIASVPHVGYKLLSSPDRLFPSEITPGLRTKFIGKKIYYFDSLPSTMDMAWQLGEKNAAEGTLVIAESQSKGRGRFSREWVSPKYKGIYCSLILKPRITPAQSSILTILTAVSISQALEEYLGIKALIKWPNDILVGNKKLGGILTELSANMDEIRFVVIGFGLNVNTQEKALPPGATSLREVKASPVSRVELLQKIALQLETKYLLFQKEGSAFILDEWRLRNDTLGRRVRIAYHKDHIEGEAFDIDIDGALLLRKDSGLTQRVTAGDVTLCR